MSQHLVTKMTFGTDGRLYLPGEFITIPDAIEAGTNLTDVSKATRIAPVIIAPIGPTGPNPTLPQQLPNGAIQTGEGYMFAGAPLAPEVTIVAPVAPLPSDDEIEEEEATSTFDASPIVEGTFDDVQPRLASLTAEQLDAVAVAEASGKNRTGVKDAIAEARLKLP